MRRTVPTGMCIIVTMFMALCLACLSACGNPLPSEGTSKAVDSEVENEPETESMPELGNHTAQQGTNMVGNGDHLFLFNKSGLDHRIYRTDASLESPAVIDEVDANSIDALCVTDDWLYYAITKNDDGHEIRRVHLDGSSPQTVRQTKNAVSQFVRMDESLVYNDGGSLEIGNPEKDVYEEFSLDDALVRHVVATSDSLLFTASSSDDGNGRLYRLTYDESTPRVEELVDVGCTDSFAIVGDDIYYLAVPEGEKDDGESYELMRLDATGEGNSTGVRGHFREVDEDRNGTARLVSYGESILYSMYESGSNWKHYGFDTATNRVFGLEIRPTDYIHHGVQISDATNGFAFLMDDDASRLRDDHRLFDLSGSLGKKNKVYEGYLYPTTLSSVLKNADKTVIEEREEAEKAKAEAEKAEAAAAEAEEMARKYADEPYGPGTSKLHLSSGSKMASYRLVRMDGSTEFMVLLEPNEKKVMTFPSGRYRLKVAEGDTWISDEEAFGSAGTYSTTNVFTFEPDESYTIASGDRGDFHHDDSAGFLS
ncbi:MAG: DUF5050 domain-containing protein [Coriobacteriales bacterium]|nr:DUF5050 domain-containing protein [Coriobacteriales bacterium]